MIELINDQLTLAFPEIHPDARLIVEFQRTLRIPASESCMPRLPSLGRYPLYLVDEYSDRVPAHWLADGGAILPMYQSEAMWLSLQPTYSVAHQAFYPFAVKLRVGDLDAVCGSRWSEGVHPYPQDFLVINAQSWLGGFRSHRGIRQFVAMPLGSGYLPDSGHHSPNRFGHIEIVAYPMSAAAFEMRFPRNRWQARLTEIPVQMNSGLTGPTPPDLGPDALERQLVEEGLFPFVDWQRTRSLRYSLRLANSLHWCAITGGPPPIAPSRMRALRHRSLSLGLELPAVETGPVAGVLQRD